MSGLLPVAASARANRFTVCRSGEVAAPVLSTVLGMKESLIPSACAGRSFSGGWARRCIRWSPPSA